MMRVSGNVWFEVSKRGEHPDDDECHITNEHSSSSGCSPLLLTSNQTLPLTLIIEHHITNEHSSSSGCSPLLLTSNQTLPLTLIIEHHITNEHSSNISLMMNVTSQTNIPEKTDVHLFCSLRTKRCHSLSSSNITSQTNIHHKTDVHLFCSLRTKRCHSLSSSNIRL